MSRTAKTVQRSFTKQAEKKQGERERERQKRDEARCRPWRRSALYFDMVRPHSLTF